jgi:hypothetical protein
MDRDDKGRFLSENQAGRKSGVPNRSNAQIKDAFQMLLENNIDLMQEDILSLEPNERLKFMLQLATFIIPKMKSIQVNDTSEETITIDFNESINFISSDN